MAIKIGKEGQRRIRETTAVFEYLVNGELKSEEIRVLYYSWTTQQLKDTRAARAAKVKDKPDEPLWLSELLVDRIHSLPDLVDEKGKPAKITAAFLDSLDVQNLQAISEAIEADTRPKPQPAKS